MRFESPAFDDVLAGNHPPANADTITVQTFDGLDYAAKVWPAQDGNYFMTISIAAAGSLPNQAKAQGETLAEKRAQGKQFANWTCKLSGYAVEPLLKTRDQLLVESNAVDSSKTADNK